MTKPKTYGEFVNLDGLSDECAEYIRDMYR